MHKNTFNLCKFPFSMFLLNLKRFYEDKFNLSKSITHKNDTLTVDSNSFEKEMLLKSSKYLRND